MKKIVVAWTLLALAFCIVHAPSVVATGPDTARAGPTDPARVGPDDPARVGPDDPAEIEAFVDDFWAGQMVPLNIPGAVFVLVRGDRVHVCREQFL
jgi:hypothetical protein